MPMTAAGKKVAATSYATAVGMLLYDVDPTENPNGALLVQGVVDKKDRGPCKYYAGRHFRRARHYPAGQHWRERVRRDT